MTQSNAENRIDAPRNTLAEDVLERGPFVEEIVHIIHTAPLEWRLRVGIYGTWGSGKTSVLNMLHERLQQRGHVLVRFDPWGLKDAEEMFNELADAIVSAASDAGIDVPDGKALKNIIRMVETGRRVLNAVVPRTGPLIDALTAGLPSLRRTFDKEKLRKVIGAVMTGSERRFVVLIDDLDRLDPSHLPRLLFALHEVLSALPIIFVLAMDPAVVGIALKAHHPGFDDGQAFLAKIVQFPRWLPEPTQAARAKLASEQLLQLIPDLDPEIFRQEFSLLPNNPRELQTLMRGLWGLAAQRQRYDDGDINWRLLLRVTVMRHRFRSEFEALLADSKLLDEVAASALMQQVNAAREKKTWASAAEGHSNRIDVTQELPVRSEFINALSVTDASWDGSAIAEHANMLIHPPCMTKREFNSLLDAFVATSEPADARNKIVELATSARCAVDVVARRTVELGLQAHGVAMAESLSLLAKSDVTSFAIRACNIVKLIQALLFGCPPQAQIMDSQLFIASFRSLSKWAKASGTEAYQNARTVERALLLEMCENASDPGGFLECLRPWDSDDQTILDEFDSAALIAQLRKMVEETFVDVFNRAEGVSSILSSERYAEQWCLIRHSVFAKPENIAYIKDAASPYAAFNSYQLLRLLINDNGGPDGIASAMIEIAKDTSVTQALWKCATRVPINPRMKPNLQRIRSILDPTSSSLAVPAWW